VRRCRPGRDVLESRVLSDDDRVRTRFRNARGGSALRGSGVSERRELTPGRASWQPLASRRGQHVCRALSSGGLHCTCNDLHGMVWTRRARGIATTWHRGWENDGGEAVEARCEYVGECAGCEREGRGAELIGRGEGPSGPASGLLGVLGAGELGDLDHVLEALLGLGPRTGLEAAVGVDPDAEQGEQGEQGEVSPSARKGTVTTTAMRTHCFWFGRALR